MVRINIDITESVSNWQLSTIAGVTEEPSGGTAV